MRRNAVSALFIVICIFMAFGCSQSDGRPIDALRSRVTDLEKEIENIRYVPGLGSIMTNIQVHHTKLYIALEKENWELAAYLVHEIEERFEDVETYHPEHEEKDLEQLLPMMVQAPMDSLESNIERKNSEGAKKFMNALTVGCNNCHQAAGYPFMKIVPPDEADFMNQAM